MSDSETPSQGAGFRRAAVVLAILVAVAGAALVLRPQAGKAPVPPAAGAGAKSGSDDVGRALAIAKVDSSKKSEWVEVVPGFDVADLTAGQRETFIRFANAERCSCGCGFTLAACRRFDSACEVSTPRVEALLDSVRRGLVTGTRSLRTRPAGV